MTEHKPPAALPDNDTAEAAPTGDGAPGSTRQELDQLTQRGVLPSELGGAATDDSLFRGSPVLAPPGDATGILWPSETPRRPTAPARPDVPGYEIIDVLGSGGMGVVYRARQVKLSRLVALKMMLGGAHDAEQLARFATEAQAVAELHHPNIVQIYEVGEHAGLPYFSLEYIGGGSLGQKAAGKPQPAEFAVRMVATLAKAIHCAHQKNIVHRDLKPSNVLLTENGVPKITDFGLAKRMESPARLTKSGVVLGTPSYMAPEQARGEIHLIGPRADVYALGAILYELVTGRPPFVAASEMDTVMQVVLDEPLPPRRLQPKLPLDIDTICLKCLEKEPEKRYETAEALADDLRRFLDGEPIVARPISAPERVWRWCRRNRWQAASIAVIALGVLSVSIVSPVVAVRMTTLKNRAQSNEAAAIQAKRDAEHQRDLAQRARELEGEQRQVAEKQRQVAEEQRQVAEAERDRAKYNQGVAAKRFDETVDAYATVVSGIQSEIPDTPETRNLKQQLDKTAIDALRRIAADPEARLIVDPVIASAYLKLGRLFERLGWTKEAIVKYQLAQQIRQALFVAGPDNNNARVTLAMSHTSLAGAFVVSGRIDEALSQYGDALKLVEGLPTTASNRRTLAGIHRGLGYAYRLKDDPDRARHHFQQALEICRQLVENATADDPGTNRRLLLFAYWDLGDLSLHVKDTDDALAQFRHSLEHGDYLAGLPARTREAEAMAKSDLATCHAGIGRAYLQGNKPMQAREEFDGAFSLLEPLVSRDPRNLPVRSNYALILARAGRHTEATTQAEEIRRQNPTHARYLYNVACCYSLCVEVLSRQGNHEAGNHLIEQYTQAALAALAGAIENRYNDRSHLDHDSDLDAIRKHPEFQAIVQRMN